MFLLDRKTRHKFIQAILYSDQFNLCGSKKTAAIISLRCLLRQIFYSVLMLNTHTRDRIEELCNIIKLEELDTDHFCILLDFIVRIISPNVIPILVHSRQNRGSIHGLNSCPEKLTSSKR